jgi:hypothetical protein
MADRRLFLALLFLIACPAAWAQLPAGAEFQVNSYTTSLQFWPAVAWDANGNFVVAWTSDNQDGSGYGVFGQRFDASGVPQEAEFRVNSYTTGPQSDPALAFDPSGNFVVVWQGEQDGNGYGIFGRRFNAAGVPQGSEFQVNAYTTGWQRSPKVASDATGNFVVVWYNGLQDGSSYGVFGQRFDAAGVPQGSEFQVNSYTTGFQGVPAVASDATGNFVVLWENWLPQDGNGAGVFGQRFDAAGLPQGTEFRVNSYTSGWQRGPAVASDAGGNFVVVWYSYGQDGSIGVFGQRFNASGLAQGGEFRVNSYTTNSQWFPAVASDAGGNFVVVWQSYGEDGSDAGVFGQRFNASGLPQGGEFQVNSYTTSSQGIPAVASGANGNFVVAWQSLGQDGSDLGIFGQRFSVDLIFRNGFE